MIFVFKFCWKEIKILLSLYLDYVSIILKLTMPVEDLEDWLYLEEFLP